ncbi:MAG: type I-D CRISPR-associated helicase Cas3' [archaeon]|nr:type I-D CRISPR-associated helicase Cas3' [archaeon]
MESRIKLQVDPRFVKEENGFRPFQIETLDAIKNSDAKIILVEAPVGSGKSYIIRNLIMDEYFKRKAIVLTYPTKILMDAQVGAMKKELSESIEVAVWPEDEFVKNGINIFNYSSSSLVRYLQESGINIENLNKSELLKNVFLKLSFYSPKEAIVTSPDVLWLLVDRKVYKGSKRLQLYLKNALVFFDEFHLYSNLSNFPKLVDDLLETIASKVILLSATPYQSKELEEVIKKQRCKEISFSKSVAKSDEDGEIFNYPLDVEIYQFKYTRKEETLKKLSELIPEIEKPAAVIFDSLFRLQHLKREIENMFGNQYKFPEWSGMEKSRTFELDEKTVVLGTSAIEVGIDMQFKSLITEVSYWTSAIQRIGRVGRKLKGKAIMFTNRDFVPYVEDEVVSRDLFENEIVKKALRDPIGELVSGEMFRGDSYNFVLKDKGTKRGIIYSESLFALYDIKDYKDDWRISDMQEKKGILKHWGINNEEIERILIHDRILPLWGAVLGELRDEYCDVKVKYNKEDKILDIIADERYTFYGA